MGAAAGTTFDRLARPSGVGRPGQHGVLGGDPPETRISPPPWYPGGERGDAQHPGAAELHQARPFAVVLPTAVESDRAQLIGLAAIGSGHGTDCSEGDAQSGPAVAPSKLGRHPAGRPWFDGYGASRKPQTGQTPIIRGPPTAVPGNPGPHVMAGSRATRIHRLSGGRVPAAAHHQNWAATQPGGPSLMGVEPAESDKPDSIPSFGGRQRPSRGIAAPK
jgi:hypothetical protein